jgi:hypothetical protein
MMKKVGKEFYLDLRILTNAAPRITRRTVEIPIVFHPAAASPSPINVKAANKRNSWPPFFHISLPSDKN